MKGLVKVNLGCGPKGKDDWVNVDYGILALLAKYPFLKKIAMRIGILPKRYTKWEWPKNLVIHDCRKKLPFKDNQMDYVYTSHLIEHFSKYEAINMLNECFRILKPGGYIRVIVPDLELLARKYVECDHNFFLANTDKRHAKDIVLADLFNMWFYTEKNREPISSFYGSLYHKFTRGHKWLYDFESLSLMLKDCGFIDIKRRKYREGNVPDLEFLDHFQETSLYVEAMKPTHTNPKLLESFLR